MSIMVCACCDRHVDTDFWPMSDEGSICESCDDEQSAYWKPLYEGEKRAGLLRPQSEINADLKDAGRGHLIRSE